MIKGEIKKDRMPSYIPIYNQIYSDIASGVYEDGSVLPSETALASRYNVCRNTLRQALTILVQDGYIVKHQGKGSRVSYRKEKEDIREIRNLILKDGLYEVTDTSVSYNINVPTQIAKDRLNLSGDERVIAANIVCSDTIGAAGHCFIQIPLKTAEKEGIDIDDEFKLRLFLTEGVYKTAVRAEMAIQISTADVQVIPYLGIEEGTILLHIEQILYDKDNSAAARVKYSFLPDRYKIQCII